MDIVRTKENIENKEAIIEINNLAKSFVVGDQNIPVLKGVNLRINAGDFVVIFGPSGCGKSTLLYSILGLEVPTSGSIMFLDEDIYTDRDEDARTGFRKKHIGMVYQQSNWINSLTVLENVALPLILLGEKRRDSLNYAMEMLKITHMTNWANYKPTELSSGQQQKVALSRALITNPEVIIADEPTGNLDYESGQDLIYLFNDLNHVGKTIVMVTHDLEYLKYAKTAVKMLDGEIVEIYDGRSDDVVALNDIKFKKQESNKKII